MIIHAATILVSSFLRVNFKLVNFFFQKRKKRTRKGWHRRQFAGSAYYKRKYNYVGEFLISPVYYSLRRLSGIHTYTHTYTHAIAGGRKPRSASRNVPFLPNKLPSHAESRTKGPGPLCITTSFKNRGGKIQPGHPLAVEHGGSWREERRTCSSHQSQG